MPSLKNWSLLKVRRYLHIDNFKYPLDGGSVLFAIVPGQSLRAQIHKRQSVDQLLSRIRQIYEYRLCGILLRREVKWIDFRDYYLTCNGVACNISRELTDQDVIILSKPARGF